MACLYLVSVHQMAPLLTSSSIHLITALLLIYQPLEDKRLSWPSWLTYSGQFTHKVVTCPAINLHLLLPSILHSLLSRYLLIKSIPFCK